MLARRLLLAGAAAVPPGRYWIIPGGKVLTTAADGSLRLLGPADGWPNPSDSGDVYVDPQRRVGFPRWHYHGGPNGEVVDARIARKATEEQEPHSLGAFPGGQAGENARVFMNATGYGLGGTGHTFWNFTLEGGTGSHDTGYTADWPWDQQDDGDSHGNPTNSQFIQTIQKSYTPGLAYPLGVIATRDLAVVLRRVATTYSKEPAVDPTGRPWLGWTMDGAGTLRRVQDLTLAAVQALAGQNGFAPPDDAIVVRKDASWAWQWIRPIGIVNGETVQAVGVLQFDESYVRSPTIEEWPFQLPGAGGGVLAFSLTDAPTTILLSEGWATYGQRPVEITETRSTFVCVVFDVTKAGVSALTVTGRASSRAITVSGFADTFTSYFSNVFKRVSDGGYVYPIPYPWGNRGQSPPTDDVVNLFRYDGGIQPSRYYTSPNGWRVPVIVPQTRPNGSSDWSDDPSFMSILLNNNSDDHSAFGPSRPDGWDDSTQGPWQSPPNDIDFARFWSGILTKNPSTGQVGRQNANSYYGGGQGQFPFMAEIMTQRPFADQPVNPLRSGQQQGYQKAGQLVVARSMLNGQPFYGTHLATLIVPGCPAQQGANAIPPAAAADSFDPAVRLFQWPGRSTLLARSQGGAWTQSVDGSAWQACVDLGPANGTSSAAISVQAPDPPSAS